MCIDFFSNSSVGLAEPGLAEPADELVKKKIEIIQMVMFVQKLFINCSEIVQHVFKCGSNNCGIARRM